MNATPLKARLFLIGFFGGILAKFWLIWESEIADATDDPHEYVLQVLYPVNGGLAYGPGTGMVGRLFYDLGLPFRLGIEAAFLVAIVLVLRVLMTWPWKSGLSLGLFLFAIFDPAPAELFSHFYSDQVWFIETLLGFSCFALALQNESRPNWIVLNLAALFLGLSTLTRSVIIPLSLAILLFAVLGIGLLWVKNRKPEFKTCFGALVLSLVSLLLIVTLVYEGTCIYNLRVHGYDGISLIDNAEYKKFYFCLQSVGDPTGKRYYPIDENRRKLIAQAGPISKAFMEGMDPNGFYKKVSQEHYGTADIASGWLEFALLDEAYQDSNGDLQKCFALLKVIESEIDEANRRGVLKKRTILPLPDSRVQIVAEAYPGAIAHSLSAIVHEPPAATLAWDPTKRYDAHDFTLALNRRVIQPSPLRDQIWGYLCGIYGMVYTPLVVYIYGILWLFFWAVFASKWRKLSCPSLYWMAQQVFGILFLVLLGWYALFDASGWPALSRYMIFNHVMLPILLVYYLAATVRLLRTNVP